MNKKFLKKTTAAVIAALMAASVMTGCKNNSSDENNGVSDVTTENTSDTTFAEPMTGTRPLISGDDYAINKINNKSPENALPGGYKLLEYSEEEQGKLFLADKSQVIIRAYNYKDDLQDMATWADSACANMKLSNVLLYARDTDFKDPEDVKVCGFDGIRYDTDMIQYQFVDADGDEHDENDGEEEHEHIKQEVARFKGRNYFFYSEQDAYVIMFECREENWDEQVELFEKFVKDLTITKTSY